MLQKHFTTWSCEVSTSNTREARVCFEAKCKQTTTTTRLGRQSITYLWSWALLENLSIVQPLKNFPALYGIRRLITVFTTALHWSLSCARSTQSIPSHPIFLRSNLKLPTTYVLVFVVGSSFWRPSYVHSSSPHSCYMLCPSHPPWLDNSNYVWRGAQVMKLIIMQFSPISGHFISLQLKNSP
jgi:hypothetical protein